MPLASTRGICHLDPWMKREPRFLILETSGRVGQVALAEGERLCGVRRLEEPRRHARDLAPAVRELLAQAGWTASNVQAVLVSRGPGSYTGLRVGIMSAKTFVYATGCRLLAIDTFAAIALQAPADAGVVDVLADAQQNRVYVERFAPSDDGIASIAPIVIRSFDDWLNALEPGICVSGPGIRGHEEALRDAQLAPSDDWDPRAESLLRLGCARFQRGEQDDMWSVEPLYLRPSAAETQWKK
jgi:tRNA threonylcarbamoyladenosine biosynthesis protein TsaB